MLSKIPKKTRKSIKHYNQKMQQHNYRNRLNKQQRNSNR